MSETYTPTAKDVRTTWGTDAMHATGRPEAYAETVQLFDRWLAKHDEAARAEEREKIISKYAKRIGNGIVAVQAGESEPVVLGMLRGECEYDVNEVVWIRAQGKEQS